MASQYVSSDGLVAWKSSRLGANFYTPNIFVKSVKELPSKLLDSEHGTCRYPIDIMIIAGISIAALEESCHILSKFVTKDTTVLMSADFGCELEKIALKTMGDRCKCVLSIACDVECRQLSLGSYALVNDDNCEIYFGITYSPQNYANDLLFVQNEEKVLVELNESSGSTISRMISQLEATQWMKVKLLKDSQKMALKLWQLIIPKISLNILSIIYEQFDYEKMLENKSTEIIFKGLVHELLDICSAQCKSKVEEFLMESEEDLKDREVNFMKVIEQCKTKRMELITTTANEYPEYLFLPFESYCFYHRFEYPAQVLLYQPILLAEEFNVSCSNLNFLYGFYTRLLSLSGLSINGGRLDQDASRLNDRLAGFSSSSSLSSNKKLKKKQKSRSDKNKARNRDTSSKAYVGQGIFAVASPAGADYKLPLGADQLRNGANFKASNSANGSSVTINDESTGLSDSDSEEVTGNSRIEEREVDGQNSFDPLGPSRRSQIFGSRSNTASVDQFRHFTKSYSQSDLCELSTTTVPQFSRKFYSKPYELMPMSLRGSSSAAQSLNFSRASKPSNMSSLELQLRSSSDLAASGYPDMYKRLSDLSISPEDQAEHNARRKQYGPFEKQLWQFQRRRHIMNGTIPRLKVNPYDDLLSHIEILCGEHNNEIVRFTTSRYGDLDLYASIQRDKDHIVSLFERGPQLSRKRLIKDSSKDTMGLGKLPHSR